MKIILASASPRRRELLGLITENFEVVTADVDERKIENELTGDLTSDDKMKEISELLVKKLSFAKAQAVFEKLTGTDDFANIIVIGADTCVVTEHKILGKPNDNAAAVQMLTELSGRKHYVVTGVAIISAGNKEVFAETSIVEFNDYDDYQKRLIEKYCATNEPYDKAGAYGIQQGGALLVKKIEGDYFNVVGLPVARVARVLDQLL